MEYCEKGDLSLYLSNQMNIPITEGKIWEIGLEILSGLATMHKKGIIHRDIKPKNIFITRKYQIKIGDFGICAQHKGKTINEIKQLGTLQYTSPEIYRGDFYSEKTDIWSFGCVIYELCTFTSPFPGYSAEIIKTKVLKQKVPPIPLVYSKDLQLLLDLCLNKDPAKRPTAEELLQIPCIYDYKYSP